MQNKKSVYQLTISALLIALGILIPFVMPRITVGPASFTLASHVPVFLAMFISPFSAVVVSIGTAFGFFMTSTPIIAMRAASHLIFAVIGAYYLKKNPQIVFEPKKFLVFNLVIGVIHSAVELVVIAVFFTMGNMPQTYYDQGFFMSIILLMGLGGFVHSFVDYSIAFYIAKTLAKSLKLPVFVAGKQKMQKLTSKGLAQ
ncbi:hypothetical protein [Enterococcus timonensis]|uniref:hypothetical protein n=1 Tax=Enterococcus timonensis TaxID=1852364 RepID=UPI0008DA642A|nr:hypothetical protein [Enterococcus timonensis]